MMGAGVPSAPRHPIMTGYSSRSVPVSWYLPAELADAHEDLRARAYGMAVAIGQEVAAQAAARYPADSQAADRRGWYLAELRRRGIPGPPTRPKLRPVG